MSLAIQSRPFDWSNLRPNFFISLTCGLSLNVSIKKKITK